MLTNLRQLCYISLLTITVNMSAFAENPADNSKVLTIQHWQTNNNANVYFVNLPELPIIDIDVIFNAGSAYDDKKYGLANLTNTMIGQSARQLSADQIAENFDNVAADFDVSAHRDSATIHLRSLTKPELLQPALKTFTTVVAEPSFDSKSFKRVKNQTLQAILQEEQTPSAIADNLFFNAVYNGYPYAHPTIGDTNTVKKLTPEDLLAFYKKYYVGSNTTIVIVGDVTHIQAEQIANQITKKMPKGKPIAKLTTPSYQPKQKIIHGDYPASQTYIRMGQLGISRNNKDYFPLYVGNYILGGGVLVSRLFKEVRETKGLTYNVYSYFLPMKQKGPFLVSLQTRTNVTNQAISLIKQQVQDFNNKGPSATELTAAKQNIIGGFPLLLDSNEAILSQVANIAFYGLPLTYLDTYRDNINNVSIDDIKNAFNQYVNVNDMVVVTVGRELASNEKPKKSS